MVFEVIEGDCMKSLSALAEDSVDAVITDPPYGVGISAVHKFSQRDRQKDPAFGTEEKVKWDDFVPWAWIEKAAKKLKPGGAFLAFTDHKELSLIHI